MRPTRIKLESCSSTNDEARRGLIRARNAGEPAPMVLVRSDVQTAGRGRQGNYWYSPPGGLWLTIGIAAIPHDDTAGQPLPLLVGLALSRAIEEVAAQAGGPPLRTAIKWPNDILIHDRKVAGILLERVPLPHDPALPDASAMLIGVGVNANVDLAPLDSARRASGDWVDGRGEPPLPATTLRAELDRDVDLPALEDAFLDHLGGLAAPVAPAETPSDTPANAPGELAPETAAAISDRLAYVGREVQVRVAGIERAAGRVLGIDQRGRLLLQTAAGPRTIESGNVSLRPVEAPTTSRRTDAD